MPLFILTMLLFYRLGCSSGHFSKQSSIKINCQKKASKIAVFIAQNIPVQTCRPKIVFLNFFYLLPLQKGVELPSIKVPKCRTPSWQFIAPVSMENK